MKKHILLLCTFLIILFSFMSEKVVKASSDEMKGEGTQTSPYLIDSLETLVSFRDSVNSGNSFENCYILQTKDIDMNPIDNWEPIGVYDSGCYFLGNYDGGGHVVQNLYITRTDNCGFFGALGGSVTNFGIESGEISGSCVGGIASHSTGDRAEITNCYNKADVVGTSRAGGIADNFNGIIINCWATGAVEAEESGGIVSYDSAKMIEFCYYGKDTEADSFARQLNWNLSGLIARDRLEFSKCVFWENADAQCSFADADKTPWIYYVRRTVDVLVLIIMMAAFAFMGHQIFKKHQ